MGCAPLAFLGVGFLFQTKKCQVGGSGKFKETFDFSEEIKSMECCTTHSKLGSVEKLHICPDKILSFAAQTWCVLAVAWQSCNRNIVGTKLESRFCTEKVLQNGFECTVLSHEKKEEKISYMPLQTRTSELRGHDDDDDEIASTAGERHK